MKTKTNKNCHFYLFINFINTEGDLIKQKTEQRQFTMFKQYLKVIDGNYLTFSLQF